MKKTYMSLAMILVAALTVATFYGCGDAGGRAKTVAPVMLVITDMDGTSYNSSEDQMFQSDVCEDTDSDGVCDTVAPDKVTFTVKVLPLDPGYEPTDSSQYMDVIITGYEVKYTRIDTGTDVPKTFTGSCTYYCPLNEETDCDFITCRADMKMMPPLSYLTDWSFGYEPSTGLTIIHTRCTVTLWGKTVSGREVVSDPISFTVEFANWAD